MAPLIEMGCVRYGVNLSLKSLRAKLRQVSSQPGQVLIKPRVH